MRIIPSSELIVNADGSIFHLHLRPEQLSDTVLLVGDPDRVNMVAAYFDTREYEEKNREFHTITGTFQGKRISCVSHGIGTDNIDIVLTELDALKNIDLEHRCEKDLHTQLTLVRMGTSGGIQDIAPVGSYVVSEYSIGFDGLLNYYDSAAVREVDMERAFVQHTNWSERLAAPYFIKADEELVQRIGRDDMVRGITISAPGFYGPQGRYVRARLAFPELNSHIQSFRYNGRMITNFEMESSAVAGLGKLLGHKAMTVCAIIAGRVQKNMNTDYKALMEKLVQTVLERL